MPHHAFKRRPRTAWLLLTAAAAGLSACSGNGSYRVTGPPVLFNPVFGAILSKVRNDLPDIPDPNVPGLATAQVDRSDPAQSIKSVLEAKG